MNDYCNGIAYATGSITKEKDNQYLVVRNSDPWYVKCIAEETGDMMYKSGYCEKHMMADQWIVKARNITKLPALSEIQNIPDFCRAYIEIHGVLDTSKRKNNKRGITVTNLRERRCNTVHQSFLSCKRKENSIYAE